MVDWIRMISLQDLIMDSVNLILICRLLRKIQGHHHNLRKRKKTFSRTLIIKMKAKTIMISISTLITIASQSLSQFSNYSSHSNNNNLVLIYLIYLEQDPLLFNNNSQQTIMLEVIMVSISSITLTSDLHKWMNSHYNPNINNNSNKIKEKTFSVLEVLQ
jgi:hypothetical protein